MRPGMRGVSAAGRRQALRRSTQLRRRGAGFRALAACAGASLLMLGALQFWHCGTLDCASHLTSDASQFVRIVGGNRVGSPGLQRPRPGGRSLPPQSQQEGELLPALPTTPRAEQAYESLTLQELRDRAVDAGASAAAVAAARDADDAKRAMYDLVRTAQQEKQRVAEAAERAAADAKAAAYTEDLPMIPLQAAVATPPAPLPLSPPAPTP